MRKYIFYTLFIVGVLTLAMWGFHRFVEELPFLQVEGSSNQWILIFASLLIVASLIANFKDILELFIMLTNKDSESSQDVLEKITTIFRRDSDNTNRLIMLDKVDKYWIKGVLEKSLFHEAMVNLEVDDVTDLVEFPPWSERLRVASSPEQIQPSDRKIIDLFSDMDRALLILGKPGAGKTTALLKIAKDASVEARQNLENPIPVVLNLASWTNSIRTFENWLIDELILKYKMSEKVAVRWVGNDELLLLLDGLDEVNLESRIPCVEAINQFRLKHGSAGIAVCSRKEEYERLVEQDIQLELTGAIELLPISHEQIERYLHETGSKLDTLNNALKNNKNLQELAQNPLMLNIMSVVYHAVPTDTLNLEESSSIESASVQLFDAYIERMFHRTTRETPLLFPKEYTIERLSWLATRMLQHDNEFLIENLQPSWLSSRKQQWIYAIGTGILSGVLMSIIHTLMLLLLIATFFWFITSQFPEFSDLATDFFSDSDTVNTLLRPLLEGYISGLFAWIGSGFVVGTLIAIKFGREEEYSSLHSRISNNRRNIIQTGLVATLAASFVVAMLFRKNYGTIVANEELLQLIVSLGVSPDLLKQSLTLVFEIFFTSFLILGGLTIGTIFGLSFGLRVNTNSIKKNVQTIEALNWDWLEGFKGVLRGFIGGFSILFFSSTLYVFLLTLVIYLQVAIWAVESSGGIEESVKSTISLFGGPDFLLNIGGAYIIATMLSLPFGPIIVFALAIGVVYGLIGGIAGIPVGILIAGLRGTTIDDKAYPNQGIRQSGKNAILVTILFFTLSLVVGGLIGAGIVWIWDLERTWLIIGICALIFAYFLGTIGSLAAAFSYGGIAVIQNILLRMILSVSILPRNLVKFLDYAVERTFLQRVGGGYIFMHGMVQEHFASLSSHPVSKPINFRLPNLPFYRSQTNTRLEQTSLMQNYAVRRLILTAITFVLLAACITPIFIVFVSGRVVTAIDTTEFESAPDPFLFEESGESNAFPIEETAVEQGRINLGENVEVTLMGGESHIWVFDQGPGLIDIIVNGGNNMDTVVEIHSFDGTLIEYVDNTFDGEAEELIAVEIPDDSEYIITVRDFYSGGDSYTIEVLSSE